MQHHHHHHHLHRHHRTPGDHQETTNKKYDNSASTGKGVADYSGGGGRGALETVAVVIKHENISITEGNEHLSGRIFPARQT